MLIKFNEIILEIPNYVTLMPRLKDALQNMDKDTLIGTQYSTTNSKIVHTK